MKLYDTAAKEASAEQTIEKSRFIASVKPVESREEADEFIAAVKKKYRDATHNVPAMAIGDKFQIQWASDDGEPQGTAGAPVVQMLVREGITNTVIVVTRYFGGIKLGTGGLVRAYTGTAKLGIEAAGICSVEELEILTYAVDYTYLARIQNAAQNGEFAIRDIRYADSVTMELACPPEAADTVAGRLSDITGGRGILREKKTGQVRVPVL